MLDHTNHLRVKQDKPQHQDTPLHTWVLDHINHTAPSTISDIIAASGATETQVRDTVADLFRAQRIVRKLVVNGSLRYWAYADYRQVFDGYKTWRMPRTWRQVFGDIPVYGYASIREIWQVNSAVPFDVVERIIKALWRSNYLTRRRRQHGSRWFYEYRAGRMS